MPFSGAIFSDGRCYRYDLWRIWDLSLPMMMFIGLNPSTANETKNDATIRRLSGFKNIEYGGFHMTNLYAYISTEPKKLLTCADPVGNNDLYLIEVSKGCETVVFCWGGFKEAKGRAKKIIEMFPLAYCFGKNADGSPKHPLYLRKETSLIKF